MTTPTTYGDVTHEYRAARAEAGRVDGLYDLLWCSGADAVDFLENLVSQNVAAQEEGTVRRSFLLGPRGKITSVFWVLRGAERVGLLTEAGQGDVLSQALNRYRIRVDVAIEADERPIYTRIGPESPPVDGWSDNGELTANIPLPGNVRSITTVEPGFPQVGLQAWTAIRVEAGEPLMGVDIGEDTIPQESGLVPVAVDFAKGCFLGQELVARIDSRGGHTPRRLMGVMITTNVIPPAGAEVVAGDKKVGTLTSPAESLALRAPVGLSLTHRDVEAGDAVTVRWDGGEAGAVVADLPLVG